MADRTCTRCGKVFSKPYYLKRHSEGTRSCRPPAGPAAGAAAGAAVGAAVGDAAGPARDLPAQAYEDVIRHQRAVIDDLVRIVEYYARAAAPPPQN